MEDVNWMRLIVDFVLDEVGHILLIHVSTWEGTSPCCTSDRPEIHAEHNLPAS